MAITLTQVESPQQFTSFIVIGDNNFKIWYYRLSLFPSCLMHGIHLCKCFGMLHFFDYCKKSMRLNVNNFSRDSNMHHLKVGLHPVCVQHNFEHGQILYHALFQQCRLMPINMASHTLINHLKIIFNPLSLYSHNLYTKFRTGFWSNV